MIVRLVLPAALLLTAFAIWLAATGVRRRNLRRLLLALAPILALVGLYWGLVRFITAM